jgi:hypothetical protein
MRRLLLLSGLTVTAAYAVGACRFRPPGDTDSGPVDTSDSQRDSMVDTDDTEPGETGETAETDEPWPWPTDTEFIVKTVDDETWAEDGYITLLYELHPEADAWYDSLLDDENAAFYMLVPEDVQPEEQLTMLMWFHGGAIGDDRNPEKMPDRCTKEKVMSNALKAVENDLLPTAVARNQRWAVVIPRNDWCDSWLGHGPDDPIDPVRHYGSYHVGRVLDFLYEGGAGFQPSGQLYGWGTSMGGTAAILAAHRHGRFTGIIADSPPSSMFLYYELNTFGEDDAIMEHILGGPPYDELGEPTEWWENYYWASGETVIASGELQVPLYIIWNTSDTLCDPPHVELLIDAMNAAYPDEVRHGEHDMAHRSPGTAYHTQSTSPYPPQGYSGSLLIDFLQGSWLTWTEMEDGCTGPTAKMCPLGTVTTQDDVPTIADYSAGAVRMVGPPDGAGVAWCDVLPEGFEAGDVITANFVVEARGVTASRLDTPLLHLAYLEDVPLVEKTLVVDDFLPEDDLDIDRAIAQFEATTLDITVGDPSAGVLCAQVYGEASLYLDSVVYTKAD